MKPLALLLLFSLASPYASAYPTRPNEFQSKHVAVSFSKGGGGNSSNWVRPMRTFSSLSSFFLRPELSQRLSSLSPLNYSQGQVLDANRFAGDPGECLGFCCNDGRCTAGEDRCWLVGIGTSNPSLSFAVSEGPFCPFSSANCHGDERSVHFHSRTRKREWKSMRKRRGSGEKKLPLLENSLKYQRRKLHVFFFFFLLLVCSIT